MSLPPPSDCFDFARLGMRSDTETAMVDPYS
jgi:hypothetical protein